MQNPRATGGRVRRKGQLPGQTPETEWPSSPYLLQHLSGKLQLPQLLLVCSCNLSIGFGQLLLLERPQGGQGRAGSVPASEAAELLPRDAKPHWVPTHLGLDALLQGSHSGSLGGRPCLGGLQGAAVGVCLQLVVLSREERTTGEQSVGEAGVGQQRTGRERKHEWIKRDKLK